MTLSMQSGGSEILKQQVRLGFVAGVFVACGSPCGEGLWRVGGAEGSHLEIG